VHALFQTLPAAGRLRDTGNLRDDLLALLRHAAELLSGAAGDVPRATLAATLQEPTRTEDSRRFSEVVESSLQEVARRAVRRGEIDEAAVSPRQMEASLALLRQHFLYDGPVVPDAVIVEIVDDVMLPLLGGGRRPR
jgi:hypothetical protein